jgi:hypothetical protein
MKYIYKFINYLLERIKFMIVLRQQDKWMRERAIILSKRDWHRMYIEESKKIFPDLWEESENNE